MSKNPNAALGWLQPLREALAKRNQTESDSESTRLQREGEALVLLLKEWLGDEAPVDYMSPVGNTKDTHACCVMDGGYVITFVTASCVTVGFNGAVSPSCCSLVDLAEAVARLQGDPEFGDTTNLILSMTQRIHKQTLTDFDRAAIALITDLRMFYEGRLSDSLLRGESIEAAIEALSLPFEISVESDLDDDDGVGLWHAVNGV